jgi:NitT/TauT family transport system substrate-binding protein
MFISKMNIVSIATILFLAIACCAFAADDGMPVVRIAYSRVIDDLPFFVGIEEKLFEKEGVRVQLNRVVGANNILAAVMKDDLQAAVISSAQVFPAAQQDLPIKVVAWLGRAHEGTHCGLHVRKDGNIHSLKDLRGKKIALSNDNMNRTIVSEALAKKGMKSSDAELILGIGSDDPMQHEAILKSGRVDVIIA